MPLPSPGEEEKQEFISRCMVNETMREEFPDNRQRSAICYSKYAETKKAKGLVDGGAWADRPVSWDDVEYEIDNYPYIFYL